MKKIKNASIIILSLLILISYIIVSNTSNKAKIANELNITLNDSKIITYKDSHDNFHGDGLTYAEISLTEKDYNVLINSLQSNSGWTVCPVSNIVEILLYGKNGHGPYIKDSEMAISIPNITNGYYFFNTIPASNFPRNTDELSYEFSLNVTIALFDKNNSMIYYYKYDS